MLRKLKNSPYLGYKIGQVHNEPTEDYFILIKQINKVMKSKRHVQPNFVKSVVIVKIDTSTVKLDSSTNQYNMRN